MSIKLRKFSFALLYILLHTIVASYFSALSFAQDEDSCNPALENCVEERNDDSFFGPPAPEGYQPVPSIPDDSPAPGSGSRSNMPSGPSGSSNSPYYRSPGSDNVTGSCNETDCPSSALTAIAAAYATQGYWAQAEIIYKLSFSDFGNWGKLLYICAALGALIATALNMPPKNWAWFFLGPWIYQILVFTPDNVKGVAWEVGTEPNDQNQVWTLAEPGLANNNYIVRSGVNVYAKDPPSGTAKVAYPFVLFDAIISDQVQNLVLWTGVYNQQSGEGGSQKSNIAAYSDRTYQEGTGVGEPQNIANNKWYLMSNLKWGLVNNITAARLFNADTRDLLVNFMSSECGDTLSKAIDHQNFISASRNRTGNIPATSFRGQQASTGYGDDAGTPAAYTEVKNGLENTSVPAPRAMRNLLRKEGWGDSANDPNHGGNGSFGEFMDSTGFNYGRLMEVDYVNCGDILALLVEAFRWESGHIYYQLINHLPEGLTMSDSVYNLFYGWGIADGGGELLSCPEGSTTCDGEGKNLGNFVKDLILIHLFRNELALVPHLVNQRFSSSEEAENNALAAQRTVGSHTKYGEVYSWAIQLPYIQGILLYYLAMFYPIACLVSIVPGWYKTVLTWATFWVWVKLWDVGFAIVMVLERSVWSMLSLSTEVKKISPHIVGLQDFHSTVVNCAAGAAPGSGNASEVLHCAVPSVTSPSLGNTFSELLRVFDKSLLLGYHLDLDIANSYYIYIMSALYFAVPAITGQLVLGAKSGAAGFAKEFLQGGQQDAAKGAGQGYTGMWNQLLQTNNASMRQESKAKVYRASDHAAKAIEFGNKGIESGLEDSYQKARSVGAEKRSSAANISADSRAAAMRLLKTPIDGLVDKIAPAWIDAYKSKSHSAQGSSGKDSGSQGGNKVALATISALKDWVFGGVDHNITQMKLAQSMLSNAIQADANVAGFQAGGKATGYNEGSRRKMQGADFDAELSAWEAQRNWGNSLSAYSAAVGVLAGSIQPNAKPSDAMGMGMSGMLGSTTGLDGKKRDVAELAKHFDNENSGFFKSVGDKHTKLDGNFGRSVIAEQSHISGRMEALQASNIPVKGMSGEVPGIGMGGNDLINTIEGEVSGTTPAKSLPLDLSPGLGGSAGLAITIGAVGAIAIKARNDYLQSKKQGGLSSPTDAATDAALRAVQDRFTDGITKGGT